jgi:hypothetical protein
MKSLRFLDRRVGFSLGAVGILLGMVAPAVVPALASADSQITSRSIQMSSTVTAATNAQYQMTFTPNETGAQYLAVEFCSNTPLIGASCTAPTGMAVNANSLAVSGDSAAVDGTNIGANYVVLSATLTSGANTITLGTSSHGITNPGAPAGTFYARIMVFDTQAHAELVDGSGSESVANMLDDGSVALSTSSQIGVTAAVLESLTFCTYGDSHNGASGTANSGTYLSGLANGSNGPATGCNDTANSNPSTSIPLGQAVAAGVQALETSAVSYGAGWTQLSTNANGGAIVYLKNSNPCAGLSRNGSTCDIPAAGSTTTGGSLAAGTAGYGITFGGGATPGSFAAPSGTQTGSIDINTAYKGLYGLLTTATTSASQGNAAENGLNQNVDSAYGGYVYGTQGAPATDQNVPFGLGATISANTPAGLYTDTLGLIAVGTF